ncbi:hypothetical protein R7D97_16525 [Vibrio sp. Vb5031]|uniref:Uncharacterized protein n=1 Tax=Vibrio hepatarius TaxID=171383 RepID=A0A0M0HXW2_9VIBR|nr:MULTISPECIES: hypothetical protein [unclassified Vibrio]KOO06931.1 hypothetical protein AKJ31_14625 [Vibrio hepatarius]MDW1505790.1 hypothetical protein [Vibrio sp. Vb5031]MDW2456250.1 hypothetical protein [Vibrio sp. 1249-1]
MATTESVRELEFLFSDDKQGALAQTPFGQYEVFMGQSGSWCAEFQFGNACRVLSRKLGVTCEQAVLMCQEDFKTRVHACLTENEK